MERGVERIGDTNTLLFAEFRTTMPNIAKLDALSRGYVAESTENENQYEYQMPILNEEMAEDMADTFSWMDEAGLLDYYDNPIDGTNIIFALSEQAFNDLGMQ